MPNPNSSAQEAKKREEENKKREKEEAKRVAEEKAREDREKNAPRGKISQRRKATDDRNF